MIQLTRASARRWKKGKRRRRKGRKVTNPEECKDQIEAGPRISDRAGEMRSNGQYCSKEKKRGHPQIAASNSPKERVKAGEKKVDAIVGREKRVTSATSSNRREKEKMLGEKEQKNHHNGDWSPWPGFSPRDKGGGCHDSNPRKKRIPSEPSVANHEKGMKGGT